MRTESYKTGIIGEIKAAIILKKNGMTILDKRYRAGNGEIDIIAEEKDTIVFVEVKYRPSGMIGEGVNAVDNNKRKRIKNAARIYIKENALTDKNIRYDIVEITRAGTRIIHNAF